MVGDREVRGKGLCHLTHRRAPRHARTHAHVKARNATKQACHVHSGDLCRTHTQAAGARARSSTRMCVCVSTHFHWTRRGTRSGQAADTLPCAITVTATASATTAVGRKPRRGTIQWREANQSQALFRFFLLDRPVRPGSRMGPRARPFLFILSTRVPLPDCESSLLLLASRRAPRLTTAFFGEVRPAPPFARSRQNPSSKAPGRRQRAWPRRRTGAPREPASAATWWRLRQPGGGLG